jgi:hypothetical protein
MNSFRPSPSVGKVATLPLKSRQGTRYNNTIPGERKNRGFRRRYGLSEACRNISGIALTFCDMVN